MERGGERRGRGCMTNTSRGEETEMGGWRGGRDGGGERRPELPPQSRGDEWLLTSGHWAVMKPPEAKQCHLWHAHGITRAHKAGAVCRCSQEGRWTTVRIHEHTQKISRMHTHTRLLTQQKCRDARTAARSHSEQEVCKQWKVAHTHWALQGEAWQSSSVSDGGHRGHVSHRTGSQRHPIICSIPSAAVPPMREMLRSSCFAEWSKSSVF